MGVIETLILLRYVFETRKKSMGSSRKRGIQEIKTTTRRKRIKPETLHKLNP
jgi:hypothetical protein